MRWIALIAATLAAALFALLYLPFRVWLSPTVYEAFDPDLDSDDGGVDVDDFHEAP